MYYNVDSLLSAQAGVLARHHAELNKTVFLGDSSEQTRLTPDSAEWERELELFRLLGEVNKPVYRDEYTAAGELDKTSNLRVKSFTAKGDEPVQYIRLYYLSNPEKVVKVEGLYAVDKKVYRKRDTLSLEFTDNDGQLILTSFSFRGVQKIILNDSSTYRIDGSISFP